VELVKQAFGTIFQAILGLAGDNGMKRLALFWLFAVLLIAALPGRGQDAAAPPGPYRSGPDLDTMLGPIALYPDPLIGQMLAASTQPSEVVMADRYVQGGGDANAVDQQPWDDSVKALARYPSVLKWMDDNITWTTAVGEAFAAQQQDVMDSIQRLRAKAQSLGNLQTTPQEQVVADNGQIEIVPASPETIYVPYYDPAQVYFDAPPVGGWITFGVGFPIGGWLSYDFDWHNHRLFSWSHDHPRPANWWREPAGRRPFPPMGEHGATVWRPGHGIVRGVSGREDRGWAGVQPGRAGVRPIGPVTRPEIGRAPERGQVRVEPSRAPVRVEPSRAPIRVEPSRAPERAAQPSRPIERLAPSRASGALVGVQNSRETHESSARGAQSRGGGGGGGSHGGGKR
jgi:uncharacterized membrane protein YgcG